jgi:hypothetical protein
MELNGIPENNEKCQGNTTDNEVKGIFFHAVTLLEISKNIKVT